MPGMISRKTETLIGAAVLAAGALVMAMVYSGSGHRAAAGYDVSARFNRIDGIGPGSDVRLSGVSVGKVADEVLDERFGAVLTLRIRQGVPLTEDTAAAIHTDGLMGAKFIELQPGAADATIKPGGEITYTQDAVLLQDLLEMIIAQARAKRGINEETPAR